MPQASLDAIFRPRSVAVIGASRRPGSIGREILNNLVAGEFQGPVYPIHPSAPSIHTLKCYPSVLAVPDPIDLAILAIPRESVAHAAEECGRKGVGGLVVITAGFREVGGEGIRREEELAALVSRHGMRMIGPNCMGVFNTEEKVRLNGSFARTRPLPGNLAMMTQSGALGEVILEHASGMQLGFSMFASLGNKADITSSDLLLYLEDDPRTEILLLYLESFGNPHRFTSIARRITRKKPILAVKSGRTERGARAAVSHTGALAGSDVATDALFEQCGVIRVDSVPEMFDLSLALAFQPPPRGRRIAVVTNAGGPGILATDAAVGLGLELGELSSATVTALKARLPLEASTANPVDLLAAADASLYKHALSCILADPGVDAVLVIFVPPVMTGAPGVARAITEASAASPEKPVLGCFMGQVRSFPDLEGELGRRVPFYPYPEEACRCLAAMARYQKMRSKPEGRRSPFPVDRERAVRLVQDARSRGLDSLPVSGALELAEAYGIPVAPWRSGTGSEIPAEAAALGYPIVLKGDVPSRVHKTSSGLVSAGLSGPEDLEAALLAMSSRFGEVASAFLPADGAHHAAGAPARAEPPRFLVQKRLPPSREVLIGTVQDPVFGPLVGFGLGGIHAEILKDAVFRIAPVADLEAGEMIDSIRGRALLAGSEGQAPVDRAALVEILERVSRLVEDLPEIAELDLNPVFARPSGEPTCAVDVRVVLAPLAAGEE